MKISTRAALYSGLVMPGLGQYYTGMRGKGYVLGAAVTGLLVWLGVRMFRLVYDVLVGEGPMEAALSNINEATIAQVHSLAYRQNLWLVVLIMALWMYSIIDAYKAGKRWDQYYARVAQSSAGDQGASSGGLSG